MYTLEPLISSVYRLSEIDLTQINAELGQLEDYDLVVEVNAEPAEYTIAAVDSGFTLVKYLGLMVGLVNVAIVTPPESSRSRFIARIINDEEALGVVAKLEEFNAAYELLDDRDILLLDGPLLTEREGDGKLRALVDKALGTGHYVLSFTKEVRLNRVINRLLKVDKPINEASLFFTLLERFRLRHRSRGLLITTPVNLQGEVVGFYMQAHGGSPPIYVEATGNVVKNPSVLSTVALMMSRENYPIPLYIADKISKVSDELRRWFIMALLRVGSMSDVDPLLYRYVRDVLGYARGRNLY
ncbi:MAG: DNA double-strand break repair nuclease NurA [Caldivirga sp.]